ncbi:MAG: hypothetical protein QF371_09835 [Flavobacteriales bacterium]|nr:hypothetical protein [Flavobacteriales bacterium]
MKNINLILAATSFFFASCSSPEPKKVEVEENTENQYEGIYTSFKLTTDLTQLSEDEKQVIPILIEAAKIMDGIFWKEAYGDKEGLLGPIEDEHLRQYAKYNYGPWDRLDGDKPFVEGVGEKPLGSQFYPADMTKEEFEAWDNPDKTSLYTFIERDDNGALKTIWYKEKFGQEVNAAADLLDSASSIIQEEGFKNYLEERAKALRSDDYFDSDLAWMDMTENGIDCIIGPIESRQG